MQKRQDFTNNFRYWSRKFKRHMWNKNSARMTMIPRLDIPDILVDDNDNDYDAGGAGPPSPRSPRSPRSPSSPTGPLATHLSVDGAQSRSWYGSEDLSHYDGGWQHPLSFPRSSPAGAASHQATPSAFSFELQEPLDSSSGGNAAPQQGLSSQRSSAAAGPLQVRDILDDSIWVESIRRSATVRRSQNRGSYRYGDLG